MTGTGWFAIMILGVWVSAAVGAGVTRDSSIYVVAGVVSVLFGCGYACLA